MPKTKVPVSLHVSGSHAIPLPVPPSKLSFVLTLRHCLLAICGFLAMFFYSHIWMIILYLSSWISLFSTILSRSTYITVRCMIFVFSYSWVLCIYLCIFPLSIYLSLGFCIVARFWLFVSNTTVNLRAQISFKIEFLVAIVELKKWNFWVMEPHNFQ